MAFFEVKNISKRFGKAEVLKGVSFSVEEGEVVSIIGSSGSGKTTLLRCLNKLEEASGGEVLINGNLRSVNDTTNFGLVFQSFNLFPQYTAMQNLTLAPKLRAKKNKEKYRYPEIEQKAKDLLASVSLSDKADFYPCQLSGGQQQRVSIARALMTDPDILFFDEPTSALDPELTGEVLKAIKNLKNDGRTMVIVTHEMEFAKNASDKVIFMANGIIEEMGTPDEIFNNPKSELLKTFLNNSNEVI